MAADLNRSIELMLVGSIREGIKMGFAETLRLTKQDSSNAAVHWMVSVTGKSYPSSRVRGTFRDLRETNSGGSIHPLVGRRGENRGTGAMAQEVVNQILDSEFTNIIAKYAAGQLPDTGFYFYTAVEGDYAENAEIVSAGKAGIKLAVVEFERLVREGKTRRYRLK